MEWDSGRGMSVGRILYSVGYGVNVPRCINYCRIGRRVKLRVSGGGSVGGIWVGEGGR